MSLGFLPGKGMACLIIYLAEACIVSFTFEKLSMGRLLFSHSLLRKFEIQ